jgi:hypothetical protein
MVQITAVYCPGEHGSQILKATSGFDGASSLEYRVYYAVDLALVQIRNGHIADDGKDVLVEATLNCWSASQPRADMLRKIRNYKVTQSQFSTRQNRKNLARISTLF